MQIRLRPDGRLAFDGETGDVGAALIRLVRDAGGAAAEGDSAAVWLRTLAADLGACLADDMGLGKTLQVLTLIDLWKQDGELKTTPVLIVMPASLLANWRSEAARFTPDLRVGTIHPTDPAWRDWNAAKGGRPLAEYVGAYDLVLTTYGQFTRLKELAKLPFYAVVADEAQAIKNPGSGQSKAVRGVVSPRRLALTGTPVENRLTDLWSIFDFVNPGLLGGLTAFRKATDKTDDYSVLRKLTRPFILRRLKTDKSIIADLPDQTELDVPTSLSRKQAILYARAAKPDIPLPTLFKETRKRLHLTQAALAVRLATNQATISMIETGKKVPSPLLVASLNALS